MLSNEEDHIFKHFEGDETEARPQLHHALCRLMFAVHMDIVAVGEPRSVLPK